MINRILIRIKALQIVYAYRQSGNINLQAAENEMLLSMQKAYDLYHYMLLLIVMLTEAEQRRIDRKRFRLSKAELDNDMRLFNNRFAAKLRNNEQLKRFAAERGTFWADDDANFINKLLQIITSTDIYKEYLEKPDSFEADKEFWRATFKQIIIENADFIEMIENNSIYWADDLDMVATFASKTIRRIVEQTQPSEPLLPMFRDPADKDFAIKLLRHSLLELDDNKIIVDKQIKNWEIERVAQMDLCIMQIAVAELKNFPSIPVNVTLNEYIDLARYYSTPKSPNFINGTLDSIVKELQKEGKIFKN
jgi:N utilization substance protein B